MPQPELGALMPEPSAVESIAKEVVAMKTGVVEWFSPQRGYGFITGTEGDNIFVHYSGLIDKGAAPPRTGDQVTYDVAATSRGPKAVHVRIVRRAARTQGLDAEAASSGDENV